MSPFQRLALLAIVALAGCEARDAGLSIEVTPAEVTLAPRMQARFTADVRGTFSDDVDWSVDSGPGVIDSAGNYTAPPELPPAGQTDVVILATSHVDSSITATALLHLAPAPFTPKRGPSAGGTRVTIDGSGFGAGTEVRFGGALGTNLVVESSVRLRIDTPAAAVPGAVDVEVRSGSANTTTYPLAFVYGTTHLVFSGIRFVGD